MVGSLGLWKLLWCWHKVLRKEGRWNKWQSQLTTRSGDSVWCVGLPGYEKCLPRSSAPLSFIRGKWQFEPWPRAEPSVTGDQCTVPRSGSGIIFLLRSGEEMVVRCAGCERCHDTQRQAPDLLWDTESPASSWQSPYARETVRHPPPDRADHNTHSPSHSPASPSPVGIHSCRENICGTEESWC